MLTTQHMQIYYTFDAGVELGWCGIACRQNVAAYRQSQSDACINATNANRFESPRGLKSTATRDLKPNRNSYTTNQLNPTQFSLIICFKLTYNWIDFSVQTQIECVCAATIEFNICFVQFRIEFIVLGKRCSAQRTPFYICSARISVATAQSVRRRVQNKPRFCRWCDNADSQINISHSRFSNKSARADTTAAETMIESECARCSSGWLIENGCHWNG